MKPTLPIALLAVAINAGHAFAQSAAPTPSYTLDITQDARGRIYLASKQTDSLAACQTSGEKTLKEMQNVTNVGIGLFSAWCRASDGSVFRGNIAKRDAKINWSELKLAQ